MIRVLPKEKAIRSLLVRKNREKSHFSISSLFNPRKKLLRNQQSALKRNRKRFVRYGLLFGNLAVVVAALVIVAGHAGGNAAKYSALQSAEEAEKSNPLDTLTATDIAANIAGMTNLPEELSIINLADSQKLGLTTTTVDKEFTTLPQVLSPDIKTKEDIKRYKVADGDTISEIAEKFGVTSDTIKWSNNITTNTPDAGTTLTIPPLNGIMYKVKSGDTVNKLAQTYKSSAQQITVFNDIELTGIKQNMTIFIPNGQKPAPVYVRPAVTTPRQFVFRGGGGYAYGWCTYYAAARAGAPGGWGNANTWAGYARVTPGWYVDKVPRVGAIAQTTSMHYLGHVAIVEEVSADGTQMRISDMNGVAGWGRVGYSGWIPVSKYQWFIKRQ